METAAVSLSTELILLAWSVVLLIVQIARQASSAVLDHGVPYELGPRDEARAPRSVMAGRLDRALRNLLETYPAFVALALALAITGQTGGLGAVGAHIWFWARVAFVPLYAFGVRGVRTAAWVVSVIGLVLMLIALLT
jgi:uncharacterized MAPEG superfamily protein